ncbi:hypothetical protein VPG91_20720 [Nitrospirillum amazonense]|nr:hypothetical protein [Nitrospirillum amazonense]MEC4593438.1 hypothetical protein [Nitrospirillum amazonense]
MPPSAGPGAGPCRRLDEPGGGPARPGPRGRGRRGAEPGPRPGAAPGRCAEQPGPGAGGLAPAG